MKKHHYINLLKMESLNTSNVDLSYVDERILLRVKGICPTCRKPYPTLSEVLNSVQGWEHYQKEMENYNPEDEY